MKGDIMKNFTRAKKISVKGRPSNAIKKNDKYYIFVWFRNGCYLEPFQNLIFLLDLIIHKLYNTVHFIEKYSFMYSRV